MNHHRAITASLWSPIDVGDIPLPHRLAMGPMTRDRSTPEGTVRLTMPADDR
jgi:2,4-dienoyl-CoA reductase-like NADH-dependent reductase (Old Yellow Enzyme family)